MVSFIIFWVAILAIVFFILGIIFKAMASAFIALLSSIEVVVKIGGYGILTGGSIYFIYSIIDGIRSGEFMQVFVVLIAFSVLITLIIAFLGNIFLIIISGALIAAQCILTITSLVLEGMAAICEEIYGKFLTVITNCLDKC